VDFSITPYDRFGPVIDSIDKKRMTISFDLDDTLISGTKTFPVEKRNWLQRILGVEPIRDGTIELMALLKSQGHSICIYTTSFRNPLSIRMAFRSYGITLHQVINQQKHNRILKEKRNIFSKYPPAFGIDLHIDDSPGVRLEGVKFKFRVIIVDEADANWVLKVQDWLKS
jgi:FMN phosphatase YigB (HAD superfamily)